MSAREETNSAPKIMVKKVIRAKREKVFEAWTKAELIKQWFIPERWTANTSVDLRVGGSYSHDMISDGQASSCKPNETPTPGTPKHYLHTGEYLEILSPEKLVFSWNSPAVQNSRVTVEFRDLGESTEVTITHELLPTDELRQGHTKGWTDHLETLSRFLA